MMLHDIIKEAGLKPCVFPKCSKIQITLYDGKDRELNQCVYATQLFAENLKSKVNFHNFLCYLENENVESMNVKIDVTHVIVYYKTPNSIAFSRVKPMDPLDYME